MNLEGVTQGKINQTQKDKYRMLSVISKILKSQTWENRNKKWCFPGTWGWEKRGDVVQRVYTFSYAG